MAICAESKGGTKGIESVVGALASIRSEPIYSLLLAAKRSSRLGRLLEEATSDFDMIHVEGSKNNAVHKLVAGDRDGEWASVTVHSSRAWAGEQGFAVDREIVRQNLWQHFVDDVSPFASLSEFTLSDFDYSAAHRWGSAFPITSYTGRTFLDEERLAICGDFVGAGESKSIGTVEAAAISGIAAAEALLEEFRRCGMENK